MHPRKRKFSPGIWGLSIGYFVFYLPYSALVKTTTTGLFPGVEPPSSFEMLPAIGIGTVALMTVIYRVGWWRYATESSCWLECSLSQASDTNLRHRGRHYLYNDSGIYISRVSILLAILMLRGGVLFSRLRLTSLPPAGALVFRIAPR
jgi:hypothetical protein